MKALLQVIIAIGILIFTMLYLGHTASATDVIVMRDGVVNPVGAAATFGLITGFVMTFWGYATSKSNGTAICTLGMIVMLASTIMVWG